MNCPPMPFVPEEWHGKLGHPGDARLRRRRGGRRDGDGAVPRAGHADRRHGQADALPGDVQEDRCPKAASLVPAQGGRAPMFLSERRPSRRRRRSSTRSSASDAPMRAVQLRVLGGAMARVPADATAFAHRQAKVMAKVVCFFNGPDDYAEREAWVRDLVAAIGDGTPGAYVNFLGGAGAPSESGTPTRARPTSASPRSRGATTRPISSASTRTSRLLPERPLAGGVDDMDELRPRNSSMSACPTASSAGTWSSRRGRSARPTRPSGPTRWSRSRRGTIEVGCVDGGHRTFIAGDLLALGWLPLKWIRNPGPAEARLTAVRRPRHTPDHRPPRRFIRVRKGSPLESAGG